MANQHQSAAYFEAARGPESGLPAAMACGFWPTQNSSPRGGLPTAPRSTGSHQIDLALQQRDLSQKLFDSFSILRDEQSTQHETVRVENYKTVKLLKSQRDLLVALQQKLLDVEEAQRNFLQNFQQPQRQLVQAAQLVQEFQQPQQQQPPDVEQMRQGLRRQQVPQASQLMDSYTQTEPGTIPNETGQVVKPSPPQRTMEFFPESPPKEILRTSPAEGHAGEAAQQELRYKNEAKIVVVEGEEIDKPRQIVSKEMVKAEVDKHIEDGHKEELEKENTSMNYFSVIQMGTTSDFKATIRDAILHPYEVSQMYHAGGWARSIATSAHFEMLTMGVIAFNALWMAIDIDANGSKKLMDKHIVFQVIEHMFFAFFSFEWAVRFASFRNKCNSIRDHWFTFDSALLALMVLDTFMPLIFGDAWGSKTSILRVVRLVKIVRMARVAKLLRHFPELLVLVKAIAVAARSVVSSMILLTSMTFVFAVTFRYLTVDSELEETYFRSIPHAMKTLLLETVIPEAMAIVNALADVNILYGILVFLFIIAASVTLLNMLIGVLCEVISVVSQVERESLRVTFVKDALREVLIKYDVNHDMLMSEPEFQQLLLDPAALKVLRDTGVDPLGLVDFTEYIFCGEFNDCSKEGISFDKFVDLILRLGGANTATVKDIVDLRKLMITRLEQIEEMMRAR